MSADDRANREGPSPEGATSVRRLHNDFGELRGLSIWLRRFATRNAIDVETVASLELCVHEMVTNVIDHAYHDDELHEIVVRLRASADEVVAAVEDDGEPFNPVEAPPRPRPTTLDEATVRGYGIPILRALAQRLEYSRVDGHNRFSLAVRRRGTR
ncbi:MAG: ATP-binding protein [Planctomycetes bacterium]|nr:ATP-binding protein [Planctomycetota bacterium]MBI3845146.1 ATP-binding protein [Planctomycetota bacterium]